MWWHPHLPNTTFAGLLSWGPGTHPSLALLDPPAGLWFEDATPGPVGVDTMFIPMLHGQLASHGGVTLLGCRFGGLSIGATHTFTLRVAEVLTGVWLDEPEEKFFRRAKVVLPTLPAILGPGPIRHRTSRRGRVVLTADRHRRVWRTDEVEVEWRYQPSVTRGHGSAAIATRAEMHLSSPGPQSVQYWARQWVNPIVQLLDVLTGSRSNASSVTLWNKKHMPSLEMQSSGIDLQAAAVGDFDSAPGRNTPIASVSDPDRNPDGLAGVVSSFLELQERQEVFLELLSSSIRDTERPLRNRYLDLMAALEAFDSRAIGVGPVDPDSFKTQRRNVIGALASSGLGSADRAFIRRWLSPMSTYSLEQRLIRLHASALEGTPWTVDEHEMGSLRNLVAHGVARVNQDDLQTAADQVFDLCRRLVMRELNIAG